jgi:hypothetical protein
MSAFASHCTPLATHCQQKHTSEQIIAMSISSPSVPSESDNEVDDSDADLLLRHVWDYPRKLFSCPGYGKSWCLRSNFLLQLQEHDSHKTTAKTSAARGTIYTEWRYTTDPDLPPQAAPDFHSREDPDEHIWEYNSRDNTLER